MLSHRIVLSLALFTAGVASAQAPEADPSTETQQSAPPLLPAPADPQPELQGPAPAPRGESIPYRYRPENEVPPDPIFSRILVEAAGGTIGGAVMGLSGLLTGAPALREVKCSARKLCVLPLLFIMVPAAFVGIPISVQEFGKSFGGRGEIMPTVLGSVLGTGAGFLSAALAGSTLGIVASFVIWPVAGTILGHEISHALNLRRANAAGAVSSTSSGPRVVPVLGATPRGGLLGGLAGSF